MTTSPVAFVLLEWALAERWRLLKKLKRVTNERDKLSRIRKKMKQVLLSSNSLASSVTNISNHSVGPRLADSAGVTVCSLLNGARDQEESSTFFASDIGNDSKEAKQEDRKEYGHGQGVCMFSQSTVNALCNVSGEFIAQPVENRAMGKVFLDYGNDSRKSFMETDNASSKPEKVEEHSIIFASNRKKSSDAWNVGLQYLPKDQSEFNIHVEVTSTPTAKECRVSHACSAKSDSDHRKKQTGAFEVESNVHSKKSSDTRKKFKQNPSPRETSFDRLPSRQGAPQPSFKYKGQPVRKKALRKLLPGRECEDCTKFYDACGMPEEEREKYIKAASRHRGMHAHTNTPEGFWNFSPLT